MNTFGRNLGPRTCTFICLILGCFSFTRAGEVPKWSLNLEGAESCSCASACPCIFGSAPTRGKCQVNMWMRVKKGHYGAEKLDGISVVTTEEMGQWRKYYFDSQATPAQVSALTNIFAQMPLFAGEKVLSVEQAPVRFERSADQVRFSVPASTVEIALQKGPNGKPITIQNTGLSDYVQYRSVTNTHHANGVDFSFAGTSGATWTLKADSRSKPVAQKP